MRLPLFSMICGAVGIALVGFAGSAPAGAMPLAPIAAVDSSNGLGSAELVQYRPGYYRQRAHRREMRHYRNRPGTRFILNNKRRVFCRNFPSRC